MDRIRENESENTAVRALVVEVTYKVSLSNAKIPKEVYEELTRMIKNTDLCSFLLYQFSATNV